MKITIAIDSFEDGSAKLYLEAPKLYNALYDIKQAVRKMYKYGHEFTNADDAVNAIYDIIGENIGDLLDE